MKNFDYDSLLYASGLKKGSTVDVVIDLFNVFRQTWIQGQKFEANDFIDALYGYIGKEGNILIRAFNWDFCHGGVFDIRNTLSQAGALGNVAMERNDFQRTRHPIYSWWVKGKDANYLCQLDDRAAFGDSSVFAWQEKNNKAVQLNIGSPSTNGLTLFHYIEEKTKVSYRFTKEFKGIYIDQDGNESNQTYSMYVRDLAYENITDDEVYMDELIMKGIRMDAEFEGIKTQIYKIPELCEVYEKDFIENGIPTGVTLKKV